MAGRKEHENVRRGDIVTKHLEIKAAKSTIMDNLRKKYLEWSKLLHPDKMRGINVRDSRDVKCASKLLIVVQNSVQARNIECEHVHGTVWENGGPGQKEIYAIRIVELLRFSLSDREEIRHESDKVIDDDYQYEGEKRQEVGLRTKHEKQEVCVDTLFEYQLREQEQYDGDGYIGADDPAAYHDRRKYYNNAMLVANYAEE